jgi:hypothetical protein
MPVQINDDCVHEALRVCREVALQAERGVLPHQCLVPPLLGVVLAITGSAAKHSADQNDVEALGQSVGRGGEPRWSATDHDQIMHRRLLSMTIRGAGLTQGRRTTWRLLAQVLGGLQLVVVGIGGDGYSTLLPSY